jgi:hypothetical protein
MTSILSPQKEYNPKPTSLSSIIGIRPQYRLKNIPTSLMTSQTVLKVKTDREG